MWRSMVKVAAAVALFGVVHSVLSSRLAKRFAAETFGERARNGLYRPFFIGQSLATFGLLVLFIRRQPSRELYVASGRERFLLYVGQAAVAVYAVESARQVGIARITGVKSLREWSGSGFVEVEPEAQGPALDDEGLMRAAGPFATSRHPLNVAAVAIFWLQPRMTTNLLAFNVAATAYLVLGSLHEELRLSRAYGGTYEAYRRSGVPYFFPALATRLGAPIRTLAAPEALRRGVVENPGSDFAQGRQEALPSAHVPSGACEDPQVE